MYTGARARNDSSRIDIIFILKIRLTRMGGFLGGVVSEIELLEVFPALAFWAIMALRRVRFQCRVSRGGRVRACAVWRRYGKVINALRVILGN